MMTLGKIVSFVSAAFLCAAAMLHAAPASERLSAATAHHVPSDPIRPAALESFVDGLVSEAREEAGIAGVTISVVQDGEVRLLKGYGMAGIDPVRRVDPAQDLFRLGSISKTITWIVLLDLVDEGRVRLDAPVNSYLPGHLAIPDGKYRPILVRDLFGHTSGFEDSALGHLFVERPERILSPSRYLEQHRPDRVREPGMFSTYSNYGTALAGEIVAHLEGKDWASVAEDKFFRPMGMRRTTYREPYPAVGDLPDPMDRELQSSLATPLVLRNGHFVSKGFEFATGISPAGSLSSSAEDMSRFMLLLLGEGEYQDKRIFRKGTATLIRSPIMPPMPGVNRWAHGFMMETLPGGYMGYGHGGSTQFFKSNMMIIPDLNLGVFVSTNSPTGMRFSAELPSKIVEQFYGSDEPVQRPGDSALLTKAGSYSGQFLPTRRPYSGLEKFVTLLNSSVSLDVDPEGYLVFSAAGQTRAWVPTGRPSTFLSAIGNDILTLELDDAGKVLAFMDQYGTTRYERAGFIYSPLLLGGLALLVLLCSITVITLAARDIWKKRRQPNYHNSLQWWMLPPAVLWVFALSLFAMWGATLDPFNVVYQFPGALLISSVTAGALGFMMTLVAVGVIGVRWGKGGRGRARLFHLLFVLPLYLVFSLLLAKWGFFGF